MKRITKQQLAKFKEQHNRFFKLPEEFEDDFILLFYSELDSFFGFLQREYKGKFKSDKFPEATDRVLKHWENEHIIPANRSIDKGWRTYSYLDQIWTSIIIYLRRFGYSLQSIKKIKEGYLNQLSEFVDIEYPLLALFFAYSNIYKEIAYIVVYDDGIAELTMRNDYIKVMSDDVTPSDHILINLSNIMNSIEDTFPEKFPQKLILPIENKTEARLVELYRQKEITEFSVSKSSKGERVTYTMKPDPGNTQFSKGLMNIEFGNMAVTKAAGKVVNVTITKTEKL